MIEEPKGSALEVGRRMARASANAVPDSPAQDDHLRNLMAEMIGARGETAEDAMSFAYWSLSLVMEIRSRMPTDTPDAEDLRFVADIAATLADRAVQTLEGVTGIPRVALSGADRFSQ